METPKKLVFYGRPVYPCDEKSRTKTLPAGADPEAVEAILTLLNGKAYVGKSFVARLVIALCDLPGNHINKDCAQYLIANQFGYPRWRSMVKSENDEECHRQRAKTLSVVRQTKGDMRSQKVHAREERALLKRREHEKREEAKKETALKNGQIGGPDRGRLKTYFFYREKQYVERLDQMLKDYDDFYLREAVAAYPEKMDWDQYHKSFGLFWVQVERLQRKGEFDFSQPGLLLIKRLAHCLFTWNFRRYMGDEIVKKYAPSLSTDYRMVHVAARRDEHVYTLVDQDYPDLDFEEDPEDTIGNR